MRLDKMTTKSQEILQGALGLAEKKGNPEVTPLHLLAVALQVSEEIARPVLGKLGVNQGGVAAELETAFQALPSQSGAVGQPQLSGALRQVLQAAEEQAANMRDEYTSVEHFLLALAASPDRAGELLRAHGVTPEPSWRY